jgi:LPS sulfotransferase NodH
MQHFIIFSQARTGSTTLQSMVSCHPDVSCAFEPFNPSNTDAFMRECNKLRQTAGIEQALEMLWTKYNSFKHVWTWQGWPFLDNPFLNQQLLLDFGARIILLHRKNALRRAMSVQISDQMKIWTPKSPAAVQLVRQHRYTSLDTQKLRQEMLEAKRAITCVRGHLAMSRVPWIEIAYEDYFETTASLDSRIELLQSLFEFLGVSRLTDPTRLQSIREMFNPETTGFQNVESYHKIPNIADVEKALGSDESGHV